MTMLAQVKPENGKYLVHVYHADSITGHKAWETIAETEVQGLAIRLREFCRYENHDSEIDTMRAYYLDTHNK